MKHLIFPEQASGLRALAKSLLLGLLLADALALPLALDAAPRTWTGAGANAFWSTAANWSPAGRPVDGDSLTFPSTASRLVNTNDLPGLRAQSIVFNGPAGGITLRGNTVLIGSDVTAVHGSGFDTVDFTMQFPTGGSLVAAQPGTLIINGNILVGGTKLELVLFSLSFTNLIVSGAISGNCDVVKIGDGLARINGPQPNTYTGTTYVRAGRVRVSKSGANRTAIPGPLVIGDNTEFFAEVTADFSGQYPPSGLDVTVSSNGYWNLNFDATVSHLLLRGGQVDGAATLTLAGDVDSKLGAGIYCPLHLGAQTRTFNVDVGHQLTLYRTVSGTALAGLTLTGGGDLFLESSNSYPGVTTVVYGLVLAHARHSLGVEGTPASGTVVQTFGVLSVGGIGFDEQITLDGGGLSAPFIGEVELTGPLNVLRQSRVGVADGLVVGGGITGAGGIDFFGGRLRVTGPTPNSLAGGISVNIVFNDLPALLELAKPVGVQAVGGSLTVGRKSTVRWFVDSQVNGLPVFVNEGGVLNLGGHADILGNVTISGAGDITQMNFMSVTGTVAVLPSHSSNATANMSGILSLPGNATFNISNTVVEPAILLSGSIIGPGGFTKNGPATMRVTSAGSYSGPVSVGAGLLAAGSDTALGAISTGTTVLDGATLQIETHPALAEPLNLRGTGRGGTNGALFLFPGTGVQAGIVLGAQATVRNDASFAILGGAISGTGPFTKTGAGTLQFGGSSGPANTYTGDTIVASGVLVPFKGTGVTTIPGHLVIGTGTLGSSATVRHFSGFTIIGSVTVNRGGLWDLNGQSEGWGIADLQGRPPLTLNGGGDVQTGAGIFFLPIGGDVAVNPGNVGGSFISGRIGLDPGPHRFSVGPNLSILGGLGLDVTADIVSVSGIGGIIKAGFGTMRLAGSNTFSGDLTLNEGRVLAANSFAFGSSASGTIVNSNASLALAGGVVVGAEPLTMNSAARPALDALAGFNSWAGLIQLTRDAHVKVSNPGVLSFIGPISGAGGLTKLGGGGLNLGGGGANSYAGLTVISSGLVELTKPVNVLAVGGDASIGDNANLPTNAILRAATGQLRPTANVTVNRSGLFDIVNSPNPGLGIRTMPGAGRVNIASGSALTVSNDVSFEFSGALTGAGALNKRGIATLHLSGDSPAYTGSATVFDGTSKVDGRIPNSPVTVKADSNLRGGGAVGNVTAFETGSLISVDSVSPGTLGGNLEVGDLTMVAGGVSDGVVGLAFYGPSPTGGNDSIVARGAVNITSTRLSIGFAYPAREGDVMTLIKKNSAGPIIGNFTGWPEGIVRKLNDVTVRATYLGGDGNDFTLTVTNTAMAFSSYRLAEGNGNQTVEPDECNLLFLSLANHRTNALTITNAVLRAVSDSASLTPTEHPTDRVLVTIASAAYPTIPAGATRENLTPFQFRTKPTLPCGNPVAFELVVGVAGEGVFAITFTAVGGIDCTRPTGGCESCLVVHGQFTAGGLASTPRLLFAGAPSICYPVKPCPGVVEADDLPPMRQVVHSFTNSATNEICVTAQLDFECPNAPTNALGVAAYLGEFRINQPCLHHLGDGGAGGPPYPPFSFRVPAGTNFLIVVTARATNLVCDSYALELFGLPCSPPTAAIAKDAVTGNIRISWSSAYPDFRLQSANALSGPFPFADLATPPKLVSGQYTVTNVTESGQKFFRLAKP